MTDKEQLIGLFEKSGVKRQHEEIGESVHDNKYFVNDQVVLLGSGGGWAGFWVRFDFDKHDNLVGHAVLE